LQGFVKEKVDRFKNILARKQMPDVDIGEHCYTPYACSFFNYCRKHIPEDSIFEFSGMHLSKKYELYKGGIVKLNDVPDHVPLSRNNKLQLDTYKKNRLYVNRNAIKSFVSDLNYPLFFMDFESFQPAVPLFDNSRPYQQIPFQYSIHLKEKKHREPKHFEFLAEQGIDPRLRFIQKLLRDVNGKNDILVYNKAFEVARLKELARDFPEYNFKVEKLIPRIKDLMVPFQKKYYYAPEMKGSYSIKAVLPSLSPELSYDQLDISDGGLASAAYERLQTETDLMFIAEIKEKLLKYCKMDTLGMVRILEKLSGF
jgi:hypothetical protein